MKRTLVLAALGLALAACGGSGELRDASTVRDDSNLSPGASAKVNGLTLSVLSVRRPPAGGSFGSPSPPDSTWLQVNLRLENAANSAATAPRLTLFCDGRATGGSYVDDPATALPREPIPPKSFEEGTVLFGAPATCARSVLQAEDLGLGANRKVVRWALE